LAVVVVIGFDDDLHSEPHATRFLATCASSRVGGASVEAIDLQPAQQVREFFIVIMNGIVVVVVVVVLIAVVITAAIIGDGERLQQLRQPLGDTEG
jgi:hypothetical protein